MGELWGFAWAAKCWELLIINLCFNSSDGEVLWSSRYYYDNCSHFGAYIAPQSSISSDAGVDYYILECRGPGLPLAGELLYSVEMLKRRLPLADSIFRLENSLSRRKPLEIFTWKHFLGASLTVFVCKPQTIKSASIIIFPVFLFLR